MDWRSFCQQEISMSPQVRFALHSIIAAAALIALGAMQSAPARADGYGGEERQGHWYGDHQRWHDRGEWRGHARGDEEEEEDEHAGPPGYYYYGPPRYSYEPGYYPPYVGHDGDEDDAGLVIEVPLF
jgi:hypothetical protein